MIIGRSYVDSRALASSSSPGLARETIPTMSQPFTQWNSSMSVTNGGSVFLHVSQAAYRITIGAARCGHDQACLVARTTALYYSLKKINESCNHRPLAASVLAPPVGLWHGHSSPHLVDRSSFGRAHRRPTGSVAHEPPKVLSCS